MSTAISVSKSCSTSWSGAWRENPRPDHRTVIVHFANSTEEQVARIARLGAIVSANPYYTVGFADKYGEFGLGPQRASVETVALTPDATAYSYSYLAVSFGSLPAYRPALSLAPGSCHRAAAGHASYNEMWMQPSKRRTPGFVRSCGGSMRIQEHDLQPYRHAAALEPQQRLEANAASIRGHLTTASAWPPICGRRRQADAIIACLH